MFDVGCEPFHHIYAFLSKYLVKQMQIIKDGCVVGDSFAPCVVPNNLINVWKMLDFDMASLLFKNMFERGCKPNVSTYSKLIAGLFKVSA